MATSPETGLKLPDDLAKKLCCPVCRSKLELASDSLKCLASDCGDVFPIVGGVPVLINERNSLFRVREIVLHGQGYYQSTSRLIEIARRLLPSLERNYTAEANIAKFCRLLTVMNPSASVLILGGGTYGGGIEAAFSMTSIQFVSTDIYLSPLVFVACDAHDIPFQNESFDGIIAQGLLEHVVDPYRCVQEISRVIKQNGLVYAEVPFMQPVHAGAFDFTRFSRLGLRRLFQQFDEIETGASIGPGGALAWAWRSFWAGFATSRRIRQFVIGIALLTAFWCKWFDRWLIRSATSFDSSLEYYFLGRKCGSIISDREILQSYRGLTIPYRTM